MLLVAILAGVAIASTRPHSDLGVWTCLSSFSRGGWGWCSSWSTMLMKFAPIGAFGAIAFTIREFGLGSLVQSRGAYRHLLRHIA